MTLLTSHFDLCALHSDLAALAELLEDETRSDYDTNATLKAKTLYKSCIDTGW